MRLGICLIGLFLLMLLQTGEVLAGNPGDRHNSLNISGKVIDATTGESIPGAKIIINNSDEINYSGFDGDFEFSNLPPGNYFIEVSSFTYKKRIIIKEINKSSQEIEIKLTPANEMDNSIIKKPFEILMVSSGRKNA